MSGDLEIILLDFYLVLLTSSFLAFLLYNFFKGLSDLGNILNIFKILL